MQTQVGVIKQISGLVVAVDQNGVSRVLKVGDALYLGEVIKTSSASSKAVVSMDNGKDVTILGDESLKLDENVAAGQNSNKVADVSDLQKALLNGEDLTKLEETAAGGNAAAAGGGDGVSLGAASFDEGGHYSNINENFRSIGDLNSARGAERIGGVSGAADNAGGDTGFVDTTIPTVTLDPINNTSTVVTGKVPNPDPNTTVIVEIPGHTPVTVPVNPDGTFSVPTPDNKPLKPGTEVKVTPKDDAGNGTPVTTPVSDVVPPQVDLTPKADGTVDVVPHDNDATKVEISYTDNGGNTQTITVVKNPSAGWVVDSTSGKTTAPTGAFKLDPHSGKVTISDNATKDNTPVIAKATDGAGNTATGETTAPDKFTIKFNDDADGNGTITRGENYAEGGAKATATISIPNLAKDSSKIHVIGTGINDYYTVHKDASGNITSVVDTKGNNAFDGDNGIKVSYDYNHYQTALGNAASITAELEGTTLKATSSVKFENVKMADVEFVELDKNGNVLSDMKTGNIDTTRRYNRATAALDGDINHTTARISLPDNIQDGDVITVKYGFGPSAASLAATGGTDTTAYKYFLVHKAADGSMTVDQITSETDKTPIKSGLTSTNGAGEKFGIDIHDMPTANYDHTHSRGIEVKITGEDDSSMGMNSRYISRESMQAPTVMFVEGSKEFDPAVVGNGGPGSIGMKMEYAGLDGDIHHTTARIKLPSIFSDGDKLTVAITDYNKIYADTGVVKYPDDNPAPTAVKTFVIHKAADGTVTFDEVDASGNVIHAGIPSVNNSAIDVSEITLYSRDEAGFVHATRVDATITDHLNLNGNDSASDIANYVFRETVNVKDVTITTVHDDFGSITGDISKGGKTDDKTPELIGKADKFATIEIFDGTHSLGTTTADKDGNWSFTPSTPLNDGEHKFTAKATIGGSSKTSGEYAIDIDTHVSITLESVDLVADSSSLPGAGTMPLPVRNLTGGKMPLSDHNDILNVSGNVTGGAEVLAGKGNDKISIGGYLGGILGNKGIINLGESDAKLTKTVRISVSSDEDNREFIIKDANDHEIGRATTDANGKFDGKVNLTRTISPNEKISVEISDTVGNTASDSKVASHIVNSNGARYYNNELGIGTDVDTGTIIGGSGNDKVVVGTANHGSRYVTDGSEINLGDGDNYLSVYSNISGSKVQMGSGDDIVKTGFDEANNKFTNGDGYITGKSIVDLGDGNNKLDVGTNIDNSKVTTGSGDDNVEVRGYIWNASGKIAGTNEEYGVYLGDGNNKLKVGTNIDNSKVTTGSGDDVIEAGGYVINSKINLGDGNDTITVGWIKGNNNDINGGTGYDKLAITNPGTSINLDSIASQAHNFEELNISNKSQNTTLSVKLSDVISLTDGDNTLKITADAGDKVEFKDTGWQKGASTDGYTAYTNDTSGTTVTVEIKDEVTQPM
ncbi:retention module-containing protein [Campylobacter concisus]|uniref:Bacterial Ig-like domain-containing protein n=1 Tax=Campylobacter concisus TaxID=199 RepID=A0A2R4P296_9BACT|nr:retention module-containing protein [Campylobacter concisus]AVX44816.1 hypothetical protein CCS77_1755 [Campylobacter concisus]